MAIRTARDSSASPLVSAAQNASEAFTEEASLDALRILQLDDAGLQETFDAFTRLITDFLSVPVSLVSVVDGDRQVFLSHQGLDSEPGEQKAVPVDHSLCRSAVISARPLIVADARNDPQTRDHAAVRDLGVGAYAGYPLGPGRRSRDRRALRDRHRAPRLERARPGAALRPRDRGAEDPRPARRTGLPRPARPAHRSPQSRPARRLLRADAAQAAGRGLGCRRLRRGQSLQPGQPGAWDRQRRPGSAGGGQAAAGRRGRGRCLRPAAGRRLRPGHAAAGGVRRTCSRLADRVHAALSDVPLEVAGELLSIHATVGIATGRPAPMAPI